MEINVIASDVNADGVVDVKDAFEVRDYIHGVITSFSVHRKEAIMEIQNEVSTLNYSIEAGYEVIIPSQNILLDQGRDLLLSAIMVMTLCSQMVRMVGKLQNIFKMPMLYKHK